MQNFKPENPIIEANVATFPASSDIYRVTLTVERKDGSQITEREARLTYTQALSSFPQLTSIGKI
jgi:hypothetical protein